MASTSERHRVIVCPQLQGQQAVILGSVVFVADQGSPAANRRLADQTAREYARARSVAR